MKTIITGGAGFIGSHVAGILLEQGHQVLVLDDLSGGFEDNVPPGADFEKRSVMDPLDHLFQSYRPNVVYHLAAYAAEGLSHHIPVFNFMNNTVATANVLAAAYRAGVEHFVFTSSIAAYGHPRENQAFDETTVCVPCDPYGAAKLACEHYSESFYSYFGTPAYTIFRPHNVFGPRQNISDPYRNVVGIFMSAVLRKQPMPVFGDGSQTRSFSYITGVARCIAEAPMTPAARNAVFNVGGDVPMSVGELARHVAEVMGVPAQIRYLLPRKEVQHAHCHHERARSAFPHVYAEQVDIVTGLKKMAEYVQSRPVPQVTECPSPIEISDLLPLSWAGRLGLQAPAAIPAD
jgi:UDP-glucose 4-epimerase